MTRGCVLSVSAALLLAAAALPLSAQQPAPDYQDPASVARHYVEACDARDLAAAQMALDPNGPDPQALADAVKDFQEGGLDVDQFLTEMLLLPSFAHARHVVGDPVVNGDECRVPVVVTYSVPQTLVLRKGKDGKWHIDLTESIVTSTGAEKPFLLKPHGERSGSDCLSNLKQICLAFLMWAQDHEETFPKVEKWTDDLKPYVKNDALFRCPAVPDLECGYAMNSMVAGKKLAEIDRPAETVLIFESTKGKANAADALESVPKEAPRHNGGNNFGFCDGHCKLVKVEDTPPAWPKP